VKHARFTVVSLHDLNVGDIWSLLLCAILGTKRRTVARSSEAADVKSKQLDVVCIVLINCAIG